MTQIKGRAPAKTPRPSARLAAARARAEAVFERLSRAAPAPKTELEYSNPYTLLVAVALSAQATDVSVNKATRHLFPGADTPAQKGSG